MTNFDPGLLRHRVQVERRVATPDEAGGDTIAWEPVATLWARIDPARGDERAIAGHLAAIVSHTVTLRWREDITGDTRVVFHDRHFRVCATFDPDEHRRYVVALAEEEKP